MKEVLKNIYCSETFDNAFLLDIIHNPYDGLMVSDKKGELLCISAGWLMILVYLLVTF